jgi:hypothetical protein
MMGVACSAPLPMPSPVPKPRPLSRRESIEAWRSRIHAILQRGELPIIDTEATYFPPKYDIEFILREMERNNVAQVCFAPFFPLDSASTTPLDLHQRYPAYFVPTTCDGLSWTWLRNPRFFVETIRKEVKSGAFFLMGEHEIRHYPSPKQWREGRIDRDVKIPIDSDQVHEIFRLSEEAKVAFQIHYEIEDVLLPPLEEMLSRYPRAPVIWYHLGQIRYPDRSTRYGPAYIRSLIARFPNLFFDLALPGPGHVYPDSHERDQTIYEFTGQPPYGGYLKREWQAVLEDYPDRFLSATDIDPSRFRYFPNSIQRLRYLLLSRLSNRAQHLIAYQNAWRLITGESWQI